MISDQIVVMHAEVNAVGKSIEQIAPDARTNLFKLIWYRSRSCSTCDINAPSPRIQLVETKLLENQIIERAASRISCLA